MHRSVAQLVPQPANVDADVVDLIDVLATPDLGQKGRVLEDVTGISHEVIEQLVLGRREVQAFAAQTCLLPGEVDLEIAGSEGGRATAGAGISRRRSTALTRAISSRWLNGLVT